MTKHICFDVESIGNKPDSVILSIAFLVFNLEEVADFQTLVSRVKRIKFDWKKQLGTRVAYNDAVEFWKHPDQAEAYKRVVEYDGSEVALEELPNILREYMKKYEIDLYDVGTHVYCRGNNFDPVIFDHIMEQLKAQNPFPYWKPRCFRTAIDNIAMLYDPKHNGRGVIKFPDPDGFVKHVEEHDIAKDVLMYQRTILNFLEVFVTRKEMEQKVRGEQLKTDIPF